MKTQNSLEEQLRSWTPRRPSPRVEQVLFGEATPQTAGPRRLISLPWYQTLGVSVAACAALLLTVINATRSSSGETISMRFAPLSNNLASLAMNNAPHNTYSAPILNWTNDALDGSSMRSFDLLNTNHPLH